MYYFYIDSAQQQKGPVEKTQLIQQGISPETYVWAEGMADWQKAKDVPDLSSLFYSHVGPGFEPVERCALAEGKQVAESTSQKDNLRKCIDPPVVQPTRTPVPSISKDEAFKHLLYALLWFVAGGLIVWGLIYLLTDTKGARIRVVGFLAPFYCAWDGLKELRIFVQKLSK